MKKVINKAEDVVPEMCEGMIRAYPDKLVLNNKYKIIKRKVLNKQKVTLISGGGSGHEPAHGGYVGIGMLDAAVCEMFCITTRYSVQCDFGNRFRQRHSAYCEKLLRRLHEL